jgi:ATP-dependent DNA helicase DinG
MEEGLCQALIPGTDSDIAEQYGSLARRAASLRLGLMEPEFVILDTETTGLSPQKDSLIEIAARIVCGSETMAAFHTYVDPGSVIPALITELTGIDDAAVKGAPDRQTAVEMLADFAGCRPVIAHNASFDQEFIRAAAGKKLLAAKADAPLLAQAPWIDTVEIARIALPRLRKHSMEVLSAAFCPEAPSTHRAADDVEALAIVWRVLLRALLDLPAGLPSLIARMHEDANWGARQVFAMIAQEQAVTKGRTDASQLTFSLSRERSERLRAVPMNEKVDAVELDGGMLRLDEVTDGELEAAFSPDGLVGAMYPGYEPRAEQLLMAKAVAKACNGSGHYVIEAGTGVGKSVAYLLPLALFARRNRVVCGVATKTNALLDQLVYQELPRLSAALPGRRLAYIALKGYDHYPCLRKLMRLALSSRSYDAARVIVLTAQLLAFVSQSSAGDLDSLPIWWGDIPRFEICASSDDCLRHKCRYYRGCLLHGSRKQAQTADIVVTNHALLFRDCMFEGALLPPIAHWVIDEAHAAQGEARRQLSCSVEARPLIDSISQLLSADGMVERLLTAAAPLDGSLLLHRLVEHVRMDARVANDVAGSFFAYVKELGGLARQSGYDRVELWINEQARSSEEWGKVESTGNSLIRRLDSLIKGCRDVIAAAGEFEQLNEPQSDLSGLVMRLQEGLSALTLVIEGSDDSFFFSARLDRRMHVSAEALAASAYEVGPNLASDFYPQLSSAIFTSATIAVRDDFSCFAHGLGLDLLDERPPSYLVCESSYDFNENMTIFLPTDVAEPTAGSYRADLARMLFKTHVAMDGSVLTLFTNRREMEQLYDELQPQLERLGLSLRCQRSSTSAKQLRDEFVEDRRLSLFALRSFWEGIDAPGDTLRCVVVTRLPFGRPDDPLQLERERRDSKAWRRYALPEAIIDLRQAAGRLIRSSTDKGFLVLADARLRTKWYGPQFLAALPSSRQYHLDSDAMASQMELLRPQGHQ